MAMALGSEQWDSEQSTKNTLWLCQYCTERSSIDPFATPSQFRPHSPHSSTYDPNPNPQSTSPPLICAAQKDHSGSGSKRHLRGGRQRDVVVASVTPPHLFGPLVKPRHSRFYYSHSSHFSPKVLQKATKFIGPNLPYASSAGNTLHVEGTLVCSQPAPWLMTHPLLVSDRLTCWRATAIGWFGQKYYQRTHSGYTLPQDFVGTHKKTFLICSTSPIVHRASVSLLETEVTVVFTLYPRYDGVDVHS